MEGIERISLGRGPTKITKKEPKSGQPVSGPRFYPRTFRKRSRGVNHSIMTFGVAS
jgi:hypothetical protein